MAGLRNPSAAMPLRLPAPDRYDRLIYLALALAAAVLVVAAVRFALAE